MLTEVGGLAEKYGGFVCDGSSRVCECVRVCVSACAAVYRWNRPSSLPPGCLSVSVLVCVCLGLSLCVLEWWVCPSICALLCQISNDFPMMLFFVELLFVALFLSD